VVRKIKEIAHLEDGWFVF